MYKCNICAAQSKPKQSLKRFAIMREKQLLVGGELRPTGRMEIDREIQVCDYCHTCLEHGEPLAQLRKRTVTQNLVGGTAKPRENGSAPPLPSVEEALAPMPKSNSKPFKAQQIKVGKPVKGGKPKMVKKELLGTPVVVSQ